MKHLMFYINSIATQLEMEMAKALGTDDSVTTCDCCGKSNLKCTVAIELDDGEIVHYGRTCASRNTGKAPKVISAEIRAEEIRKLLAAQAEWAKHPARAAELARFEEREQLARTTGHRMLGLAAAEFVREAVDCAQAARAELAARYGVSQWRLA